VFWDRGAKLQSKKINQSSYDDYVIGMRSLLSIKSADALPRLLVIVGSSSYLQMKAFEAIKKLWEKNDFGAIHSLEGTDLDQKDFLPLISQTSLFEARSLYILKRLANVKNFSSLLVKIRDLSEIKSYLVLDLGDKISADLQKQFNRLGAMIIPCVEPIGLASYRKFAMALSKRYQIDLDDAAISAVVESSGLDFSKIDNELSKLGFLFAGVDRKICKADILPALGILREDDVFDLFGFLRQRNSAKAHLMSEIFLDRGESAIAITGIFARYAREQIERGSMRSGLAGLHACKDADVQLKTSACDESIVLSNIIEALAEV
jgi:DNA polymerase III delta subunit